MRRLLLTTLRAAPPQLTASVRSARLFSTPAGPSASLIRELRERTGAPMVECKSALVAESGDIEKALDWLRKKGVAVAGKKAGRTTAQGLVAATVNSTGDVGALVEINSETDFVARNAVFQSLATRVAAAALDSLAIRSNSARPLSSASSAVGAEAERAEAAARALEAAPIADGGSVREGVIDVIAKVRENVVLRRVATLALPGGVVSAYVHNAAAPGLGGVGVLVGLERVPSAGAADGAAPEPLPAASSPSGAALAELARRIAMHVAAARPVFLSRGDVPAVVLERESVIAREAAERSGKAGAVAEKVIAGRLVKFYSETVLTEQAYIFGQSGERVDKWLLAEAKKAGAPPVRIAAFAHFIVGDGKGKAES